MRKLKEISVMAKTFWIRVNQNSEITAAFCDSGMSDKEVTSELKEMEKVKGTIYRVATPSITLGESVQVEW